MGNYDTLDTYKAGEIYELGYISTKILLESGIKRQRVAFVISIF